MVPERDRVIFLSKDAELTALVADICACADIAFERAPHQKAALELLKSARTDVALLDGDGFKAADVLAALAAQAPGLAGIVLLAKPTKSKEKTLRRAGAVEILSKAEEGLERLLPRIIALAAQLGRLNLKSLSQGALLNASSDALIEADDENGGVLAVNQEAVALYGYGRDEFVRKRLADLYAPGRANGETHVEGRHLHGRDGGRRRERHLAKDGRILYVEVEELSLAWPTGRRRALLVHDLTGVTQQQEELTFLQQFNTHLLDNLPLAITVKTGGRLVTYQNAPSRRVFGDLAGKKMDEAAATPEERAKLQQIENLLTDGRELRAIELEWREASYIFSALRIKDFRSHSGLIVELGLDVTRQKYVQRELVEMQRMEAVGSLAGGIAHDFNNILSGILGYANLIQAVAEDNEPVVRYASVIEESCTRASELTKQLLQFARRKAAEKEIFDLADSVRYASKLLRHSVKKDVRVDKRLTQKKLLIQGDPARIQQLLVNLGLHANETMSEGVMTFSTRAVEVAEGSPLIEAGLAPGQYAAVSLEDSGRGMDVESLKSIIEPDFSALDPTQPVSLAISVVHAIARAHGGRLLVETGQEQGTVVTVYLPLASLEEEKAAPQPESTAAVAGTETVLVIDDEEVIRNLMLTSLSRLGYRVLVASGGDEGLKLYDLFKNDVSLVILDLGLPDMDGEKVFRRLRAIRPDARVVLFSGAIKTRKVDKLMEAGARAWVAKPISIRQLSLALREALDSPNE